MAGDRLFVVGARSEVEQEFFALDPSEPVPGAGALAGLALLAALANRRAATAQR